MSKLDQLIKEGKINKVKPSKKKLILNIIYYFSGTILSLIFIFPLLYMIATSTKTEEAFASSLGTIKMFLPDFSSIGTWFNNYSVIFGDYGVWKYALNSLIYALIVIILNVLINGLAGYVLAKFNFPGKKFFNFIIMFLIVVPVETSIIPLYSIVKQLLGLTGKLSVLAVILPSSISIFNIFLFRQFFVSIPTEYEEAARIDGLNNLQIFFKIILPLSKPIVATVSVFCFIGVWNDYLWPSLVFTSSDLLTAQIGLNSITSNDNTTMGQTLAVITLITIPVIIIYALFSKQIVEGVTSTGSKEG